MSKVGRHFGPHKKQSLVALILLLSGCSTEIYDPKFWHTNFVDSLQAKVGLSVDNKSLGESWTRPEVLVDISNLPDGKLAYRYRLNQGCEYIFDVDPSTHIIKATHWKGSDQYCILVP
ncbi:MAG: hypothetical protein HY018_11485 [Hydrogenophilales bacterium]|nr:hypothetical protein [Hydrogenophilales bacterium]